MRQLPGVKRIPLLFFILCLNNLYSLAQNIDTVFTNELVSKAQLAMNRRDVKSAIDTLNLTVDLLQNSHFSTKLTEAYELLADAHAKSHDYQEAANALKASIAISEELDKSNDLASSYELMCFYLYRAEAYKEAIDIGEKALRISQNAKDSLSYLRSLSTIADCYSYLGNWDNCLNFSYKGLELAQTIKDSSFIAVSLSRIARVYKFQKAYQKSEEFQKRALRLFEFRKDTIGILVGLNDLGILYKEQEKYTEALDAYQKALAISIEKDIVSVQEAFYINLGNLNLKIQKFDEADAYVKRIDFNHTFRKETHIEANSIRAQIALHQKKYREALVFIERAHELALENNFFAELPEIAAIWASIYEQQGNYLEALKTHKLYADYRDSLLNSEKNKRIQELQTQYETAEKEKKLQEQETQIQLLDREKELSNLKLRISIIAAIFIIILIMGIVYLWRRQYQFEQARILAEQERLNEKNRTLEEVSQLKSRFFSNISHELRTPLTLITAPLASIQEKFSSTLPDEIRQQLNLVSQNAGKLLSLVSELLELSRLEAGKVELIFHDTAISTFCRQIFSLHESHAQRKRIIYQFESTIDEQTLVSIDRNRVEKIINNLLSNALKYTDDGGRVSFHLSGMPQTKDGGLSTIDLQLTVSDTGRGIPSEDIPHVFDRYFQSKRKDVPIEGGTGIGLALAKELAAILGGDLSVQSEWGKGSSFQFVLPVKVSQPSAVGNPQLADGHPSSNQETLLSFPKGDPLSKELINPSADTQPTVLIVEDNRDVQDMLFQLLKDEYNCVFANNGKEALNTLLANGGGQTADGREIVGPSTFRRPPSPVSLILSDLMMPQMDGHELLEKLKADDQWRKIPTIMLTALATEGSKLKALRLGVDDYLIKPFSPSELKARIANLIVNFENRQAFIEENDQELEVSFEEKFSAEEKWLRELEKHVKEAMDKKMDPSADYLADAVALSRRQLLRRLKAATGFSIKQYVQEIRLQKARHLLENKQYQTIAEVAYACSFNTPGYFSKIYEKRFGKKPSEYW